MEDKLKTAREEISKTDEKIAELFRHRMKQSETVAEYKRLRGLPVEDKTREEELIRRNSALVPEEELRPYYVEFQRNIMKLSCDYQHALLDGTKIAYCGEEGAFAYFAAKKIFPDGNPVAHNSFSDAYEAALSGECEFAVLPIENSFAGEVGQVTDMIFSGSLVINGIYDMAVTQALLGIPGAEISGIKTVKSHPQALSQCAEYIRKHNFGQAETSSTSAAAKNVALANDKSVAAIACEEAAAMYGLAVLDRDKRKQKQHDALCRLFEMREPQRGEKFLRRIFARVYR